jgi:hypothetical protein
VKRVRNENGVALLLVLIMTLVASIAIVGLLYMASRGGYMAGQQMRYRNALEAAKGGAEAAFQVIGDRGRITVPIPFSYVSTNLPIKLTTPTSSWGSGVDNSVTINPDNTATFDMSFDLGRYRVFAKITDTVEGNSGANIGLITSGVVNTGSGEVVVVSHPYLYTIEELAQDATNPSERVKFSILYQY